MTTVRMSSDALPFEYFIRVEMLLISLAELGFRIIHQPPQGSSVDTIRDFNIHLSITPEALPSSVNTTAPQLNLHENHF